MRRPIKARAKAVARTRNGERMLPLAVLILLSALVLSGCNTIAGFGEDVAATGESIDQTAEQAQDEMTPPARDPIIQPDYQAGTY